MQAFPACFMKFCLALNSYKLTVSSLKSLKLFECILVPGFKIIIGEKFCGGILKALTA